MPGRDARRYLMQCAGSVAHLDGALCGCHGEDHTPHAANQILIAGCGQILGKIPPSQRPDTGHASHRSQKGDA